MPASRFFDYLPLLKDGNKQVGVCAMGPVGDGDRLVWMTAWFWQQNGEKVAAATGSAGVQVPGAQKLKAKDKPPFKRPKTDTWMVQAALERESAKFTLKEPAQVQATALVERDGDLTIIQWSQAVELYEPAGPYPSGPGRRLPIR